MLPIVSLLFVLCMSLVINRVATVALTLTGLPREMAKFQARSAFSGAGFTTGESEQIVNHPVRRRIVQALMLWGNVGFVSVLASMMFSAAHYDKWDSWHWGVLIGGIIGFYFLATSKLVEKVMVRGFDFLLKKFTRLQTTHHARLLQLDYEYGVQIIDSSLKHMLIDQKIGDLRSGHPRLSILGVQRREGDFVGEPADDFTMTEGDSLILYGHIDAIHEFYAAMR